MLKFKYKMNQPTRLGKILKSNAERLPYLSIIAPIINAPKGAENCNTDPEKNIDDICKVILDL